MLSLGSAGQEGGNLMNRRAKRNAHRRDIDWDDPKTIPVRADCQPGARCKPQRGRTKLWQGAAFPERRDTRWGVQPFMWTGMLGWYKRYCLTASSRRVGYVPYQTALHFPTTRRVPATRHFSTKKHNRNPKCSGHPRRGTLIIVIGAVPPPRNCKCYEKKPQGWITPKGYAGWVSSACSGCLVDLLSQKVYKHGDKKKGNLR